MFGNGKIISSRKQFIYTGLVEFNYIYSGRHSYDAIQNTYIFYADWDVLFFYQTSTPFIKSEFKTMQQLVQLTKKKSEIRYKH